MKAFFNRIRLCCTQASSYPELRKKTFWNGVVYLYWLLVIVAFLSLAILIGKLSFVVYDIKNSPDIKNTIVTLFPNELVLTMKDGELSTNVKEPYIFPLPAKWKEALESQSEEIPSHFLTIDTSASFEDFYAYDSLILLTKTAVIARKEYAAEVVEYKNILKEEDNFMLDSTRYKALVEEALPLIDRAMSTMLIPVIAISLLVMPLIAGMIFGVIVLLYLVIATLLAWLLAAIMQRRTEYSELYRIGLYALTPSIIIESILVAFGVSFFLLPTAIFLITMGMVLQEWPKKQ